mgnify:CR=1 FL=1
MKKYAIEVTDGNQTSWFSHLDDNNKIVSVPVSTYPVFNSEKKDSILSYITKLKCINRNIKYKLIIVSEELIYLYRLRKQ